MEIRAYLTSDCSTLAELFYNTVHTVNVKDYSQTQLGVWATGDINLYDWNKSFLEHNTLIAEEDGIIVGFGDIDNNGYIDRLYVHRDYQGQGIATAIVTNLEKHAVIRNISSFTTHASITAKPFFEKQGYKICHENVVIRQGVRLTNFIMEKNSAE